MAATITLSLPPGTDVVLPASGLLPKSAGAALAITIANAAGEPVLVESSGATSKFTVGALPPSVADGQLGEIPLTVLASGTLNFQHKSEESALNIVVAGAAVAPFSDRQQQLRYVRP